MPEKLKDIFFTDESLAGLAGSLSEACADFDAQRFLDLVKDESWEERALKEKMRHVTTCLHQALPLPYPEALETLKEVAPSIRGFEAMVFPDYVECYGLEHWDLSLPALAYFTRFASSEFAVRPFLAQDPPRAMAYVYAWAEDENEHVRRLASEGCRPRLPWAMALPAFKADPTPILPVLEQLKGDESEYVRRSVANNLNDISKDHPDLVLAVCEGWYGQSERTDWIVKHACRTMLKAGNRQAMLLFGFADPTHVRVRDLCLDPQELAIGDEVQITFDLLVDTVDACLVRLEYEVAYVKAKGKISSKVFQIREVTLDPGSHTISKKHSFADRSTRKHYAGQHEISIVVNGVEMASASVQLNPAG